MSNQAMRPRPASGMGLSAACSRSPARVRRIAARVVFRIAVSFLALRDVRCILIWPPPAAGRRKKEDSTMVRMRPGLLAAAVLGALLACPRNAAAQDPAVVNASTIKVTFENDRVRVLEATL